MNQDDFFPFKKYTPSKTTESLVTQLLERDAKGKEKYGTSLDRKDLSVEEWLQHQIEELLDGAGYAASALRSIEELRKEMAQLRVAAQEYALLRTEVDRLIRELSRYRLYSGEPGVERGRREALEPFKDMLYKFDIQATIRQLREK